MQLQQAQKRHRPSRHCSFDTLCSVGPAKRMSPELHKLVELPELHTGAAHILLPAFWATALAWEDLGP